MSLPYDFSTDLRLRSYAPNSFLQLVGSSGQGLPPVLCYYSRSKDTLISGGKKS